MRSVEEQLALITDTAMTPEPVRIAITDALGMMCAEEVQASQPLPGFPQAAIDGYAVRAVDIGGERALRAGPPRGDTDSVGDAPLAPTPPAAEKSLPVVGEVPAGSRQPLRLQPKQVVRVHTGAPLPTLSDAVLPLEWTDRGRKRMTPYRAVRSGDFVRRVGDDIQRCCGVFWRDLGPGPDWFAGCGGKGKSTGLSTSAGVCYLVWTGAGRR